MAKKQEVNYNKVNEEPNPPVGVEAEQPKETKKKTVKVTSCKLLNVRKRPESLADVVAVVKEGDVLTVESRAKDWVKVSGIASGFVMSQFVTEE